MTIGFDDCVKSATEAINKHSSHHSVLKIQRNKNPEQPLSFHSVYTQQVSKYFNPNSRRAIHHSFIVSNFSYCPLVWHFCGKTNNAKLEKIQGRSRRILFNDYTSSYEDLLRVS